MLGLILLITGASYVHALPTHVTDVSVFLDHEQYAAIMSEPTVRCSYYIISHDKSKHVTPTLSTEEIHENLSRRFSVHAGMDADWLKSSRQHLTVMVEHFPGPNIHLLASVADTVTLYKTNMSTPSELLCLETLLQHRIFHALIPFETETELLLTRRHNTVFLNSHFGFPVIIPPADIINTFTNKSHFADWMVGAGFGAYIPSVYHSLKDVEYPVMVKFISGTMGRGITIAHTLTELVDAVRHFNSSEYILQQAVTGSVEPSVFIVARAGRILGMMCMRDRQNDLLFVAGGVKTVHLALVPCSEYEAISPIIDLLLKIVAQTEYNGFGCVNFKYTPARKSQPEIDNYMRELVEFEAVEQEVVLVTDFTQQFKTSQTPRAYDAIPKLFEINARTCGPLIQSQAIDFVHMMRLYIDDVISGLEE